MKNNKFTKLFVLIIANFLILFAIYLWYRGNISWQELNRSLQTVPTSAAVAALIFGIVILIGYGIRLSYFLKSNIEWASFWPSFWITSFGFGANNILPFRMGDIAKVYFAKNCFNISATQIIFVKVVEKYFDLMIVLAIGICAVVVGSKAVSKSHVFGIFAALFALFCIAFSILFLIKSNFAWVVKMRMQKAVQGIIEVFKSVISNPAKKQIIGVTFCIWVLTVAAMFSYYTLVFPSIHIGVVDILALVFLTTLSLGIPSVPGSLGLFEATIVFYLNNFLKVPAVDALACALVLHLVQAGPQIVLMIIATLVGKWKKYQITG